MPARPFVITPRDYAPALDIVGEHITILASGEATGGCDMFTDMARELSPVNPDLGQLAEIGARHGLKVAG